MTGTDAARETRRRGKFSRALTIALMLVGAMFLARSLAPQTIGEQVRRSVLNKLADHYGELGVTVRRGQYEPDIGLVLDDVRFSDPHADTSLVASRELVRVERVIVVAEVQPEKLLSQHSPIVTRRIILDGVTADAWLEPDGRLSLQSLWPPPRFGPVCPRIELRRVKLRLVDRMRRRRPLEIDLSEAVMLSSTGADGKQQQSISLQGSSEFFQSLRLKATSSGEAWSVRGAVAGAHFSRDLFDRLPESLGAKIADASELDATFDSRFAVGRRPGEPIEYLCRTTVHDGRFDHDKLPVPLAQLRGVVTCDPQGVQLEASQAMLGDAVCRASGQIAGHAWPADVNLAVSANGLWLDERLAAALPPSFRDRWDKLRPIGRVDIDAQVSHSGGRWRSDATILCKGVNASFDGFPYPAEEMIGRIEVRDGIARSQSIDGRVGGRRMQCAFHLPLDSRADPRKTFSLAVDGPVAIGTALLEALTPRGEVRSPLETFVRSLKPRGNVHVASAVITTDASGRTHREIDLRIVDGHLQYEKFAYPLYNVAGQIEIDDSLVRLVGFRATNANAGVVLCDGTYEMTPTPQLSLQFRASNVPMDESLRSSLPAASRQTWDALSPSGVLDQLNVLVSRVGLEAPLGLDITAQQHASSQLTNRTLSLRPVAIPYRLDIAGGTVRYDGAKVVIESVEGRHDFSRLSADGVCTQDARGQWLLDLDVHSGSRVNPDAELIASLPAQMSESLRRLQLRGPISVRGNTKLLLPSESRLEPAIDWSLVLQLEGNRIGDVGPVHSLRGEVSIDGRRDEAGLFAAGNVRIDSMHVDELQITGIRGPYAIDGDRLRLGTLAAARLPEQAAAFPSLATSRSAESLGSATSGTLQGDAASIRGRLFGGALDLDGEVELSSGDFDVTLAISDAEVPTVLAELGHADQRMTGTFSGQARLDGKIGAADLLKGNGAGKLSGANLYQLPLIVQVLNQLRITPTEDVAFTDGDVEFTVFGDSVTLSRLQLWGDLVALDGGGTLNRRREVDLSFDTRVSPQNTFTRLLQPLGSQRYTLWTIDVHGPIDSPTIERRALDGVGQTLERLFPVVPADTRSSAGAMGPERPNASGSGPAATVGKSTPGSGFSKWFR